MEEFEKPRYAKALDELQKAFDVGYAEGKRQLAEGSERLAEVDSVFYVDVPRDHVLDNEWAQHCPRFELAGRRAALATRRTGQARLDAAQSDPDGSQQRFDGVLRWIVILNSTR